MSKSSSSEDAAELEAIYQAQSEKTRRKQTCLSTCAYCGRSMNEFMNLNYWKYTEGDEYKLGHWGQLTNPIAALDGFLSQDPIFVCVKCIFQQETQLIWKLQPSYMSESGDSSDDVQEQSSDDVREQHWRDMTLRSHFVGSTRAGRTGENARLYPAPLHFTAIARILLYKFRMRKRMRRWREYKRALLTKIIKDLQTARILDTSLNDVVPIIAMYVY